jgi:tRNA(adenine34) deaminase
MDNVFMKKAIDLARKAAAKTEVPVGCVIVLNKSGQNQNNKNQNNQNHNELQIIGMGYNLRNTKGNTLYHAEILAIDQACRHLKDWRLDNCTMYVTLEPCPMCAGAILQSRIPRLVYGAKNLKAGACGSIVNLLENSAFNHTVEVTAGILEAECALLMKNFFKRFRKLL